MHENYKFALDLISKTQIPLCIAEPDLLFLALAL